MEACLLDVLADAGRKALGLTDIVARGGLAGYERSAVAAALAGLVRAGKAVEARAGRYALAAHQHLRAGEVQVHPDGYAFLIAPAVAPERSVKRGGAPAAGGEKDLYISGAGLRPAMHGDRVLATVVHRRRGKLERSEARVVRVLERRLTQLLGVCRQGRSGAYLLPQDPRITYRVTLADQAGARDGDMVVAAITQYPGPYADIEARVEQVLGPASDPRVETEAVICAHQLPREFPGEVRRAAARVPAEVDCEAQPMTLPGATQTRRPWHESPASSTRLDLRSLPLITIDGENARDFDDAVALLPATDGARLLVAIADVASYVPRQSAIDVEARARGTSVYFPDQVIPMLPETLSNGICSLSPGVDRLVQAVLLDCDRRGRVLGAAFFPGVIRSRARLTYTEVRQIVADRDLEVCRRYAPLVEDLERMATLAEQMDRQRQRRGSIDFDLPEAEIVLDLRGRPEDIVKAERNIAHRLIESFMIAANEAVAGYLTARGIALPYRVHEAPDQDALRDLARFLEGFGARLSLVEGKAVPAAFQRVLAQVAERPEARLVNTVLLRSMKQARYAPANIGHFGLAADCYTHFTSPIRRYPDLVLHRLLAAHLGADRAEIETIAAELPAVCDESSRRERVAMEAEREVVQLKKVQFMQDKIGETHRGFVCGVVPFGLFVELERYFVEGLVHIATLTDDRYDLIEHEHMLVGRRRRRVFRLGDPLTVRVASVSVERRQIDLALAGC